LERLDKEICRILKMMNKKKAGKIIEAMKPENAAAILLLGIGQ
jgi:flagellar motility protein MotE (MotC chaperone)